MFLTYERNVVKLAEYLAGRYGLRLAYVTGMDIAADPACSTGPAPWSRRAMTSTGRQASART